MITLMLNIGFALLLYVLNDINKLIQKIKAIGNNAKVLFLTFCILTFMVCVYFAYYCINSVMVTIFVCFLSFIIIGAKSHLNKLLTSNKTVNKDKYMDEIKHIMIVVNFLLIAFMVFVKPYMNFIGGLF
jgi:hypothetical protein